jgi:hypothetical protein
MNKAPEIQCPRCNAVGKVTADLAGSASVGGRYHIEPRFTVRWTRNGKPHSVDTLVKQADLDDPSFGCGQD